MDNYLKEKLADRINKDDWIIYLNRYPNKMRECVSIAISNDQPMAWHAAWLINQVMKKNDERIRDKIFTIIKSIKEKKDGHQRELLRILEKMKINEKYEGYLFDYCVNIWEEIDKSPSVRILAFRLITDMVNKYPDLKYEMEHLTHKHYSGTLSPGIKNSFYRLKNSINF